MRTTPNRFHYALDAENELVLEAQDNSQRDIILAVLKAFFGKSLCLAESESSVAGSVRGSVVVQDV